MGPRHLSACLAFVLAALSPATPAAPTFGGCPVFPADNYWNTRVDSLPLHPSSAAWVNTIGALTQLHPDWSNVLADNYGFTPTAVPGNQPLVPITFYPTGHVSESDAGPFPIPPALALGQHAGTFDREVVVVDTARCILYELYGAPVSDGASWIADSSAKWDLRSNALRPDGFMSADRAGLPMLPGLMRWEEVAAGEIAHAIRFTASNVWGQVAVPGGTAMKYLWPARHGSGTSTDETRPPMGARFRLKSSFDITSFDPRTQIVLRAFKKYGLVLASSGGNWFLQGVSDESWPDSVINELRSIAGENFEAVDTAPLQVNPDSGQAVQLASAPDAPTNLSVTPGNGQATFTFTPPASGGASPIVAYTVTCDPGALTGTGTQSPITVTGLGNGTTYTCSVTAVNATGPGTASNSVTVTLGVSNDAFPPGGVPSGWIQPASSNAAWVVANDAAYAGSLSLKSGFIGHNQKSEIAYTANFVAGNVTFARKVSSQPNFDSLQFHVDGILQASWSGEQNWSVFSFPISAGTHTLMWRYVKDGSISSGADAAWIDSVVLPALAQCMFRMPNRRCIAE